MLAPDQANTHECQAGVSTTPLPRRSWRDNTWWPAIVTAEHADNGHAHGRSVSQHNHCRLFLTTEALHLSNFSLLQLGYIIPYDHIPLLIDCVQSCTTRSRVAKTRSQLGHYRISVCGDHCQAFPRPGCVFTANQNLRWLVTRSI